ncbi:MAG: hypothetical protein M3505_03185 [Verrucomicrobiota bacterium]|nr:hypothetical protein [Chthoniobacterales bacterium]MBA3762148.1 hypothetical protein [Chthoniobacterales bacterium]MDQ3313627.1 hypothetical protein [Verrucomicrobiota bacterium]
MEPKRERRKLWLAVFASLFLHLVVAFSLAAFHGASSLPPLEEDKPVELTMVDLPGTTAPEKRANPAYIETDATNESREEPKEKLFESNANSIAASRLPATGDLPLPAQDGKDRSFLQMQTQDVSLAAQALKPQREAEPTPVPVPSVAPSVVPTPEASPPPKSTPPPTPKPVATPQPEQLAMLTATPPLALRDPQEVEASPPPEVGPTAPPVDSRPRPQSAAAGYQAEKRQTRISGQITNRGPRSSVDAVGTPLGKYQKSVSDAIGSRWYYYVKGKMDLVSIGTAHLEAQVDATGKVRNLRVLSNNANETFANICLQSFQEAQIPPIPPDLVATLPEGRLPVDITFTTYANP